MAQAGAALAQPGGLAGPPQGLAPPQMPQGGGMGGGAPPPPRLVQALRADPSPEARREFDEVFGPGAASRILMGQ
jgi:hypothetical protein